MTVGQQRNLAATLVAVARQHRDSNALWCKGQYSTYQALFSRAISIAAAITAHCEVAPDDRIAIFAEKNATPLIADFKMSNGAEGYVSTRIKMGQTAMVRAVVTAGGKTYTAAKEVKVTIGGCGG